MSNAGQTEEVVAIILGEVEGEPVVTVYSSIDKGENWIDEGVQPEIEGVLYVVNHEGRWEVDTTTSPWTCKLLTPSTNSP